jgi:uncharacterized membrane protein
MGIEVMFGLLVVVIIIGTPVALLTFFLTRKRIEKHAIARALQNWKENELITLDSFDKLSSIYPKHEKKYRWTLMQITYFVGSLFIGIGFILFIASNWEYIASWAKLGLVLLLAGIFLLTGEYLRKKTKSALPYLGEGLIFLSSLLWGAGIIFLFQSAQWAVQYNAFIIAIWVLSILPLYLGLKSEPISYLCIFLSFLWGIFMKDLISSHSLMYYFIPLVLWWFLLNKHPIKVSLLWTSAFLLIPFVSPSAFEVMAYLAVLTSLILLLALVKKCSIHFTFAALAFTFFSLSNWNTWPITFWVFWLFLLAIVSMHLIQKKEAMPFSLVLIAVYIRAFSSLQASLVLEYSRAWSPGSMLAIMILLSSCGLALSVFLKKLPSLQLSLRWISYLVLMISLFFLSSSHNFSPMSEYTPLWHRYLLITLIAINLIIVVAYYFKQKEKPPFQFPIIFLALSAFLGLGTLFLSIDGLAATSISIYFYNAILLFVIISTFFWANQEEEAILYYGALVSLLVFIVLRYTDLFWKLLDRSVFFILGGLVLLVVGIILEKQKKHIIERSPQDENS